MSIHMASDISRKGMFFVQNAGDFRAYPGYNVHIAIHVRNQIYRSKREGGLNRMLRKFLNGKMIMVLTIFLLLFMAVGYAEEEITDASGQWKYVVEDGGATLTGYVDEPIGDVVIPGELDGYPVTGIGECAFAECTELTGVTIPESVTSIGVEAFYMCVSLTDVIIPDSVISIGEWSFKECYELASVTIGSNVASIGEIAFFGCESLTDVIIPDSVTSIGSHAFAHCYSLCYVKIPASITDIGKNAFYECAELILSVQEGSAA